MKKALLILFLLSGLVSACQSHSDSNKSDSSRPSATDTTSGDLNVNTGK